MSVFRVDKSREFTVIANCVFKDKSMSTKAKGLLVEMLSLPEDAIKRFIVVERGKYFPFACFKPCPVEVVCSAN